MQPIRQLMHTLDQLASPEHCLFTPEDMKAVLPSLSGAAFKTLLSRAVKDGHLSRVCRGLYLYEKAYKNDGRMLFHAAARLRANTFNYISLETVLSEVGIISQIPINWISVMSAGRSSEISCGKWGTIEFVRTRQKPKDLVGKITYDAPNHLWRASLSQAMRDMRATHRNTDLIDWSVVNEFI